MLIVHLNPMHVHRHGLTTSIFHGIVAFFGYDVQFSSDSDNIFFLSALPDVPGIGHIAVMQHLKIVKHFSYIFVFQFFVEFSAL